MKTLIHFFRTLAIATAILAGSPAAEAASLKIGDAAPPLQVAKWVQGDPVSAFDSNHVYIVEFWATWCGPCRASIPHLNETWQKFKDKNLIVIGQDVMEPDDSAVSPFVQKMGDKMTYRVALDDKSGGTKGAMADNWLKAAGQNGIPAAFIINRQGRIAWIGHPMALEEPVLEQILADKFDVAGYAKAFEQQQQTQEQRQAVYARLRQAMQDKDWDAADAAQTEIEKSLPETVRYQASLPRLKILAGRKDYAGAYKLAGSLSDAHPDNPALQNELAWNLATINGVDQEGLALAEKIVRRANGKAPEILDTLARIQFMRGQTNEAVATEQKAVDAAPEEIKASLKKFLDDYQQGKLPEMNQ